MKLLLHAASAVLVAILAAELGVAAGWAWVAGLVFALHPVNTEAVAWVVGRAELGATAGALAGLLLWLRGARSGHRLQVAASALTLLVAIGFKESAASAVAIAAAITFREAEGHPGRRAWTAARRAWPLLVPIAARANLASALAKRGRVRESMMQLEAARQLGWRPWMTGPGALPPGAGAPPVR